MLPYNRLSKKWKPIIESINEAYNNTFAEGERVGRDTFVELTKILTKKRESKAGLSTYYINLRYSASTFTQMMKRASYFAYADSDEQRAVKKEADTLIEEWKKIQMFGRGRGGGGVDTCGDYIYIQLSMKGWRQHF